ncbi:MAG TPA: hypothetical protein ENH12_06580, partial [Proteobacteria bacterium]|nr:hypothetical protein [Pseudomonadota bacterium]
MEAILSFSWTRRDWLVLGTVLAIIFIVLIPYTFLLKGVFHDDTAYIYYPHFTFMARNIQQGIIPLWSPNVFCGGSPFYANYPFGALYPPLWILFDMADLSTPDSSYTGLIIVPIIFHILLSGLFAYLLGRLGLRLEYWGAAAFALVWTLSATMYRGILDVSPLFAMGWIPGFLLFQILYTRKGNLLTLALGGLILGFLIPSNINYVAYAVFISLVVALCLSVGSLLKRQYRVALRAIWGPAAMGVLGAMLAGGYLWGVIESVRDMAPFYPLNQPAMTAGPNSLPLRYLATLLVPNLFSGQDFSHVWNVVLRDQLWLSEAYLTRGFPLMFIAFISITGLWFRKGEPRGGGLRFWMFSGLSLCLLGLLLLLGRHTPFFGLLYRVCPLLRVPYADRWHPLYTMGLAILIGTGISGLKLSLAGRSLITFKKYLIFVTMTLVIVIAAILWPLRIGD